jgi:hypothetical protein
MRNRRATWERSAPAGAFEWLIAGLSALGLAVAALSLRLTILDLLLLRRLERREPARNLVAAMTLRTEVGRVGVFLASGLAYGPALLRRGAPLLLVAGTLAITLLNYLDRAELAALLARRAAGRPGAESYVKSEAEPEEAGTKRSDS